MSKGPSSDELTERVSNMKPGGLLVSNPPNFRTGKVHLYIVIGSDSTAILTKPSVALSQQYNFLTSVFPAYYFNNLFGTRTINHTSLGRYTYYSCAADLPYGHQLFDDFTPKSDLIHKWKIAKSLIIEINSILFNDHNARIDYYNNQLALRIAQYEQDDNNSIVDEKDFWMDMCQTLCDGNTNQNPINRASSRT